MPIYDYKCTKCGRETEVMEPMNTSPIYACAICNNTMVKLVTGGSFRLTGHDFPSKSLKERGRIG